MDPVDYKLIEWLRENREVARACDYPNVLIVDSFESLDAELKAAKERKEPSLIEVKCSIGARDDLGRPTTTAIENKRIFMGYIV